MVLDTVNKRNTYNYKIKMKNDGISYKVNYKNS